MNWRLWAIQIGVVLAGSIVISVVGRWSGVTEATRALPWWRVWSYDAANIAFGIAVVYLWAAR